MSHLRHPSPQPVHGLLSIKVSSPLSKRVRRLATLANGLLDFRIDSQGPVDFSVSVSSLTLTADSSSRSLTLTNDDVWLRLYAKSTHKFELWSAALAASTLWKVITFYEISGHVLGTGQFGVVRSALAKKEGDTVAVKTLFYSEWDGAYRAEMVERECRIARLLSHVGIVPVLDVFETPQRVDIVMECRPYTLHDLMTARIVLDEFEAAAIIRRILSAVAYMHTKNVVHRDIKPDNVLCSELIDPASTVAISDFGLANFTGKRADMGRTRESAASKAKRMRCLEYHGPVGEGIAGSFSRPMYLTGLVGSGKQKRKSSLKYHGGKENRSVLSSIQDNVQMEYSDGGLTKWNAADLQREKSFASSIDGLTLTSAIGAPSYVAPELVRGERYGKPVDVWGCGVLLYYMLVGYLPFEGKDMRAVLRQVRDCQPDFSAGTWSRVSESGLNFVKSLLHPDPLKRLTAESALEHEWMLSKITPLGHTTEVL